MKSNSLKPYETDASQLKGDTKKVVLPNSIKEIAEIVKKEKSIVIRGGGSGLVGGAVPFKETVLDLSKLDKILGFNKNKKIIIVESGIILDDLNNFLDQFKLEFPINPSSHSICTIGGMIATNAVGSRAIKYGKTSDWILWIETINSEGNIEMKNKAELMDFAGMEGITGIITSACLKLTEKIKKSIELKKFDSLEQIIERIKELKRDPKTTMIEILNKDVSEMIGLERSYYLFIETETQEEPTTSNKEVYSIRDKIYPKLAEKGFTRIEDPKLILEKIPLLLDWLEEKKIPFYGHISVGIIHPCFSREQEDLIPEMMKMVKKLGGQISGEHGIGLKKREFLDPNDKKIIINMKKRLDPLNKFNLNKVIL